MPLSLKLQRLLVLAAIGLLLVFIGMKIRELLQARAGGSETVQSRLEQFGVTVKARLDPAFQKAGVPYPPARLVLLGLKHEQRLEVYAAPKNGPLKFIRSYNVQAASGHLGPKLREGDCQVPEGLYGIEYLNPNSLFHLSLKISYPNSFDRQRAAEDGRTQLGGDIMIHGKATSVGCLAMGDEAAEDLFVLAALTGVKNISVILSPVDFRKQEMPPLPKNIEPLPSWTEVLYRQLKVALKELPRS